jgi:maltose-binding protein MalE
LKAILDAAKSVVLTPNLPSWNDATTILNDSFQRVAKGDLRPRDALTEAQTSIQPLFDDDLRRG